ncbi:MAG: ferric reductase-like transmembrane domain-containing protein [Dehalococcoidia bacterium]|nr:ferric reductase-like transmembrane domain-containing protein [Dehalococcoidia bacterium]
MWHRKILAIAALLGVAIFCLASAGAVFADSSTHAMQGKAAVVPVGQMSQLRVQTSATDSSSWFLEITLNPLGYESTQGSGGRILDVNGSFTLGIPGQPISSGTTTGWLDQSSKGDLKLTDLKTGTSLDMTYTVSSSGSVTSQVQGQWPSLVTAPVPASTAASGSSSAVAAPAQPANHTFWYISRTTAIAAYLLLFVNICLGIGLKSRYLDQLLGRWRQLDIHQFTALLGMALIGLHIFSLLGDGYFKFGMADLLVPAVATYRPFWTSLGIVAFYVLVVVVASCYFRKFIGQRAWKALHMLSFGLFLAILFHSVKAGTDTASLWMQWVYIVTGTLTVFLALWRFLVPGVVKEGGRLRMQPVRN